MILSLILVSLIGALVSPSAGAWLNEGQNRKQFTFECPADQAISQVVSEHKNGEEDRKFFFRCSPVPIRSLGSCEWSDFTYSHTNPLHYQCANSGVMTGVFSKYEDDPKRFEDRRFSFQCCIPSGLEVLHACETTWTNSFDNRQDFKVPAGYVMRGWTSVYNKKYYDRKYAITYCKVGKIY